VNTNANINALQAKLQCKKATKYPS